MSVFKEKAAVQKKEFERIGRLLAIGSFKTMSEKTRLERGICPNTCEEIIYAKFADGSVIVWCLCSGTSNYFDDVSWISADGETEITLVPSRKLENIEVEIGGNLYVVELEIKEEAEEAKEEATSVSLLFHNTKDVMPEKSGEYLCVSAYNTVAVLPYSLKHNAFNVFDIDDTERANRLMIDVTFWADISKVSETLRSSSV